MERSGMTEYQRQEMIRILKKVEEKGEKIIITDPLAEFKRYGKRGE
jgi:hypothetical protein